MTLLQIEIGAIVQFFLDYPELGWIATLAYLVVELRTNKGIVKGKLMEMIRANTVVVRAIARTNDDIDTQAAEELLTDNGHEPSDFIDMESQSAYEQRMRERSEEERRKMEHEPISREGVDTDDGSKSSSDE